MYTEKQNTEQENYGKQINKQDNFQIFAEQKNSDCLDNNQQDIVKQINSNKEIDTQNTKQQTDSQKDFDEQTAKNMPSLRIQRRIAYLLTRRFNSRHFPQRTWRAGCQKFFGSNAPSWILFPWRSSRAFSDYQFAPGHGCGYLSLRRD